MKKSILSLAVAAGMTGIAATAHAQMHLNDKGLGEALVYPFYTAENGNDTYVHVVNTTGASKAVKVRIIEARNSQEVLDFNLYMSAEDHFSFVITESDDGQGAKLMTGDSSCTAPAIPAAGQPFVGFKYAADDNDSLARTKTGYIEIIEMGQIDGGPVDEAITHDSSGVPDDCSFVIEQWSTDGLWLDDPTTGFVETWDAEDSPAGGLYGVSYVVNPEEAYAVGIDAIAIDDLVDVADANGNPDLVNNGGALHYEPGDEEPNFASNFIDTSSVIFVDGGTQGFNFAGPITAENRVDAVSSLFMVTELMNEFILDDGRLAATDWVITQPTKLFYVDGDPDDPAEEPYFVNWDVTDESCEAFSLELWDREEANVNITTGPVFSPRPPGPQLDDFVLCTEQGVLQMGSRPAIGKVAGSTAVDVSDNIPYTEGWARISFDPGTLNNEIDGLTRTLDDGVTSITGLPVAGVAVTKLFNANAKPGVEAFYATSNVHKASVVTSEL